MSRLCTRALHVRAVARVTMCVAAFTLTVSVAHAADFIEPRGELTLAAAIAAALQRNPNLQNAAFEMRAADARMTQSQLRPNPEFSVAFENFAGSGDARATQALESTLSLSQVIELGGKRARRIDAAQFGRDSTAIEREATQLDVLAEVTRRYIDIAEQQEQLQLTRRTTALSEKLFSAISARVGAARAPLAERSRAAIALGHARLDEQQALQSLLIAHRRLAALWNSSEPNFGDVKTDLFDLPAVANIETLMTRLQSNPDFLRFTNESRLRDAEWRLALAQAKSDITVGIGLRHFEATDANGFVLNFSMPLAFSNRNQGAIREASIRRDQVQVQQQAALITTQANLFAFYQQLQFAHDTVTTLRTQLIPQADIALQQTRDGYERGRFSYLEFTEAQRELLALQREAISAAATYHRVLAEIERLTATPLVASQD